MTRQYFCWKVSLSFRCGCTEQAPIVHRCPPDREGCNSWLTHKRTDKLCDAHRAAGWGLAGSPSLPSLPSSGSGAGAGAGSPSGGVSRSPSPGPFQPSQQGQSEGWGEGESGPRRRGSPVDGGEMGASAPGRRVVGYY